MPQPQVTLEPSALTATPGEQSAGTVVVVNRGDVVDEIQLQVLGPAASWARLEPPQCRLFPGAQQAVRLVLAPPAGSAVPAGTVSIGVRAVSTTDGGAQVVEGTVAVGAVQDLQYTLSPKRARGRRSAKAHVEVANRGNAPAVVRLVAPPEDDELDVRVPAERVTVAAGTMQRVKVRARPLRGLMVGQPVTRQYGVQLTPDRGAPGRVDGTAVQLPMIGRGAGVIAVLLAAIIAAVFVLRGVNTAPASLAGDSPPTPVPTPTAPGGASSSSSSGGSSSGGGQSPSANASATPAPRVGGAFHPLPATRILDTKTTSPLSANGTQDVPVLGVGGVPATGVAAVVLDFIVNPGDDGSLIVWPAGQPRPVQPVVTYARTGSQWEWTTGAVTVPPGSAGSVTLENASAQTADVRVDVEGWYGTAPDGTKGLFNPITPVRVIDTAGGGGPMAPGSCLDVAIAGAPSVPPNGVGAAVLTLTAINATSTETFLEAFASGAAHPFPSLVGAFGNSTVANQAIVPVGGNGRVTVCDSGGATNLTVDLYGWYTDGSSPSQTGLLFSPVPLTVVCDANQPGNQCTGPLAGGKSIDLQVAGLAGLPPDGSRPGAGAVALSVTLKHGPGQPGQVRMIPAGSQLSADPNARPVAAAWTDQSGTSAMVVLGLGPKGKVTLLQGGPDTVVEQVAVMGWFD